MKIILCPFPAVFGILLQDRRTESQGPDYVLQSENTLRSSLYDAQISRLYFLNTIFLLNVLQNRINYRKEISQQDIPYIESFDSPLSRKYSVFNFGTFQSSWNFESDQNIPVTERQISQHTVASSKFPKTALILSAKKFGSGYVSASILQIPNPDTGKSFSGVVFKFLNSDPPSFFTAGLENCISETKFPCGNLVVAKYDKYKEVSVVRVPVEFEVQKWHKLGVYFEPEKCNIFLDGKHVLELHPTIQDLVPSMSGMFCSQGTVSFRTFSAGPIHREMPPLALGLLSTQIRRFLNLSNQGDPMKQLPNFPADEESDFKGDNEDPEKNHGNETEESDTKKSLCYSYAPYLPVLSDFDGENKDWRVSVEYGIPKIEPEKTSSNLYLLHKKLRCPRGGMFTVSITLQPNTSAGLLFRVSDDGLSGLQAVVSDGSKTLELRRFSLGNIKVLAIASSSRILPNAIHGLEIADKKGKVTIAFDHEQLIEIDVEDQNKSSGRVGLFVAEGFAAFGNILFGSSK
eukprot:GHVP01054664.1.p1 GENE.GHVP01054664.1~~GHVP01054664.1.p1  ORF type:complete len:516 (-),score=113.32 GHVP01054664.1:497-2044(-)